jgi:hypothetical protein
MKKCVGIGLVVAVVFGATYYVVYVPPRTSGYLGLMYAWHGPQTNAGGELVYAVGVSNGGPHAVWACSGTETLDAQHVTMAASAMESIDPGKATQWFVNVGRAPVQLRAAAYAQKAYRPDWRGCAAWHIETKVLKRAAFERAYGPDAAGVVK